MPTVMAAVGSGLVAVFFLVSAPAPVGIEGGWGACISTSSSSSLSLSSSPPKAEVDKTK